MATDLSKGHRFVGGGLMMRRTMSEEMLRMVQEGCAKTRKGGEDAGFIWLPLLPSPITCILFLVEVLVS